MRHGESRWRARPLASALVRLGVFAVPVLLAVAAALVVGGLLPQPGDLGAALLWWAGVTAVATATLLGVDRLARRLLPLAALLRLSLAFPDRAPSRYRVARTAAGWRALRRRVEAARDGPGEDATGAAETALALLASLHAHDRRTRGHAERVLLYTDMLAEELDLDADDRGKLRWGALLHDVGKLAVPAEMLNKPARLAADEWALVRRHPSEGMRLCAPLLAWLGQWRAAIGEHHERWDGAGYPLGLAGEQIGLGARVVAVADAYEVMTSARPYSQAVTPQQARAELTQAAGAQFDPAMVRAFLNLSIGSLRRAMGPLVLLTQVPILARLSNASPHALIAGKASAGLVAVVGAGLVVHPGGLALHGNAPAPPPAVEAPAGSEPAPEDPPGPGDDAPPVPPPAAPEAVEPGQPPPSANLRSPTLPSVPAGAPPAPSAPGEPAQVPAEPAPEPEPAPAPAPEPPPSEPVPADPRPEPPPAAPEPAPPHEPPAEEPPEDKERGATPATPPPTPGQGPATPAEPPPHAQGGKDG